MFEDNLSIKILKDSLRMEDDALKSYIERKSSIQDEMAYIDRGIVKRLENINDLREVLDILDSIEPL